MFGQQPTGGIFGQPAQQGGLFGQQPAAGGAFGQPQQGSVFGQPAGGGGLFGQPAQQAGSVFGQQPQQQGGMFGGTQQQQGGLFGGQQQQQRPGAGLFVQTGGAFGQTGGAFGQAPATGGIFGQPAAQTGGMFGQQPQGQTAGMFGQTQGAFGGTFGGVGGMGQGQRGTPTPFQQVTDPDRTGRHQHIGAMNAYKDKSFEELRWEDYQMNVRRPQQGGGMFGGQQQAAPQTGGVFGGQTGGGLFGGQAPQTGGGIFGGQQQQPQTGGLFGQQQQRPAGGGMFGQQPAQTGGLFGGQQQQQPIGQTGGMFGQTGGGLFGGQQQQQPQQGGLFGGQQQNQQRPGGLFGQQQPQTGGLFGQTAPQTAPVMGNLFGNQQPATGGGLFGGTQQQTGGGLFGQTTAQTGGSLFGGAAQTGGSLFGGAPQQQGGGLFGQTGGATGGGGLFGGQTAAGATGGSLFGGVAATGAAPGGGLFGGGTATGGSLFGGTSGATGGGLFGSAPQTGGGLFGGTTGATGGLFGAPATGAAGGGLFGNTTGAYGTGGSLFGQTQPQMGAYQQQAVAPRPTNPDPYGIEALLGPLSPQDYEEITRARPPPPDPVTNEPYTRTAKTTSLWKPLIEPSFKTGRTPNYYAENPAIPRYTQLSPGTQAGGYGYAASVRGRSNPATPRDYGSASFRSVTPYSVRNPLTRRSLAGGLAGQGLVSVTAMELGFGKKKEGAPEDTAATASRERESVPSKSTDAAADVPRSSGSGSGSPQAKADANPGSPPTQTNAETPEAAAIPGQDPTPVPCYRAPQGGNNQEIDEMPRPAPRAIAPVLTKSGYECKPTISTLREMTEFELSRVPDFKVIHQEVGEIEWEGFTDLRNVDLDQDVCIDFCSVTVYEMEEEEKPRRGTKLNKPARVCIKAPPPRKVLACTDPEKREELKRNWEGKLKKCCEDRECHFVKFDSREGEWWWEFKVPHF